MKEFDESKHPRDEDGKFTYGTDNRVYDSRDDFRQTVERARKKQSDNKRSGINSQKRKSRIQSKVFDKIRTVRKKLEKDGYAIITVNDFQKRYTVKLYNSEKDFDFEILNVERIKGDRKK